MGEFKRQITCNALPVAALVVAVTASCDESAEQAQSFRSAVDQIWCETTFTCCTQPGYESVDACISALEARTTGFVHFGPLPEPQPDPTMWNQSRAATCLANIRSAAASCDHVVESLDYFSVSCNAAYAPSLGTGEACDPHPSEPPYCDLDRGDVCLPNGVCGPALDDGLPCTDNFQCRSLNCTDVCAPANTVTTWLCSMQNL